jgi:hypothetical protein
MHVCMRGFCVDAAVCQDLVPFVAIPCFGLYVCAYICLYLYVFDVPACMPIFTCQIFHHVVCYSKSELM